MIYAIELKREKGALYDKVLQECLDDIDASIRRADAENRRSTGLTFYSFTGRCNMPNYKDDMLEDVKAELLKHGFKIRPTGIVDGVMQDSEDIYW